MNMKINWKSILTSGLVAGLIINLSAISMVPVVGNQMDLALANRGLPPLNYMSMLFFSIVSFIFGISLVLLYAIIKNLLGAGIKTVLIGSSILWFLTYFLANVLMVVYGFMPVKLTVIGTAWGWGELLLAAIFGSRLYKDVNME
jgi:hypothetical protein